MICKKCGAEMKEIISPFSKGMKCPNCEWGWVTTDIDLIDEDQTTYEIWLKPGNIQNSDNIRLISDIAGINYLQTKKLLSSDKNELVYKARNEAASTMSKARRVQSVAKRLKAKDVKFLITPDFPFEV